MNCIRFSDFMNKTAIIKTFNSHDSNITYIRTQHQQIIATITNRFFKFQVMIKTPLVAGNTVITLTNIISFTKSIPSQHNIFKTNLSNSKN